MSILFNNPLLGASGNQGGGGDLGDTIEQSLRFTGTQNLTKTMAAGAETTFSCWVKIANLAQTSAMTFIGAGIGTNYVQLYWEGATYETLGADNSNTSFAFTSNKLRDPSAWYHLVYVRTSSDTKIYINGAEASYRTSGSGSNGALSSTTFAIGSYANGTGKFEGYMAEVYFVESVKQPSDFGKYNEDGVWVPQDYTGTYGTNGFHLTFDSSQANGIGHDSSGNGNNFTATGFDTAAISSSNPDNDVDYFDTPTSNYQTFNPLYPVNSNGPQRFNDANLGIDLSSASSLGYNRFFFSTLKMPSSGKWYFEHTRPSTVDSADPWLQYPFVGFTTLQDTSAAESSNTWYNNISMAGGAGYGYRHGTTANAAYGPTQGSQTWPSGAVIGCSYDADTGDVRFYNQGVDMGLFDTLPSNTDFYLSAIQIYTHGPAKFNFGQMPFVYTPPTGFEALHLNQLDEPTIKNGKEYFEAKLYSGTNNSNSITGLEFSPDLIWIKVRDAADNHVWVDTIRGTDSVLFSNSTDQQASSFSRFTSFDSNGFTVDTSDTAWNNSTNDYVAWCWKAGDSSSSIAAGSIDGTNPTIASTVSANTDAGFSIVSYSGNSTSGATVGHGLSSTPEMIIVKGRNFGDEWHVKHVGIGNETHSLRLNRDGVAADFNAWAGLAPTNTVFKLGPVDGTNKSTAPFIAYCWHSVEGYSKFGKYVANDNADGTFVYTGFRPSMIILKSVGLGYDWFIWDTARDTSNPSATVLKPDLTQDEAAAGSPATEIDILSNGFKIRGANQVNQLTDHIYCAWAENPFGGENAPPATAR